MCDRCCLWLSLLVWAWLHTVTHFSIKLSSSALEMLCLAPTIWPWTWPMMSAMAAARLNSIDIVSGAETDASLGTTEESVDEIELIG